MSFITGCWLSFLSRNGRKWHQNYHQLFGNLQQLHIIFLYSEFILIIFYIFNSVQISLIDRVHKIYNDTTWQDRQESDGFNGMGFVIKKILVHNEPTRVRSGEAHYNMVRDKWDVRTLLEVSNILLWSIKIFKILFVNCGYVNERHALWKMCCRSHFSLSYIRKIVT